jgi:hypothetical protein
VRARALLEALLTQELSRPLRREALRLLGEISYNDENFAEARSLYAEALEYADDPGRAATVEIGLSYVQSMSGDTAGGLLHARRALAWAEASEDRALIAEALAHCAITEFMCDHGIDWAKIDRALALEDRSRIIPLHRRLDVDRARRSSTDRARVRGPPRRRGLPARAGDTHVRECLRPRGYAASGRAGG